jgi:hypothetical protein
MTTVGDEKIFAIEYEIAQISETRVLGHFAFRVINERIGNFEDYCDLKGVVHWCRLLIEKEINRYEPTLGLLSKEEIFATVYDPEMVYKLTDLKPSFSIPNARARFDISHLGMSSFDDYFAILLVETKIFERLLWANLQSHTIQEAQLPKGTVITTLREFVDDFLLRLRSDGPMK